MLKKIDEFKEFVKKHTILAEYVKKGSSTWQKFYEMYDLYGSDSEVWKEYLSRPSTSKTESTPDLLGFLKNINLDELEENINSIGRVLSVLQDLNAKDDNKPSYTPRPLYKHFVD